MATLTTTINTVSPVGEHVVLTGSFGGSTSDADIVLVPTSGYVHSCSIATPTEDAATPFCVLNAATGGTATNGSVQVKTSGTGTYTFTARVHGAL